MNILESLLDAYVAPEMAAKQAPGNTADAWGNVVQQMSQTPLSTAGSMYSLQQGSSTSQANAGDVLNALTQSPTAKQADRILAKAPSPLERWKHQIDLMMQSGDPTLQNQAMGMMQKYHEVATSIPKSGDTSGIKEYQFAKSQGFDGNFADWKAANRATTTIQMGSNVIKAQDAANMIDSKGRPVQVPLGMTYGQAGARGWKWGKTPTEGEAKQESSFTVSTDMLNDLTGLYEEGADLSGIPGLVEQYRSEGTPLGVALHAVMGEMGHQMSPKNVKAMSIVQALSNELIAAYRGAAVGPAEQEKFESQLPMPGQPREVFMSNLELTKKNLKKLKERRQQARGIGELDLPALPEGWEFVEDTDG